MNQADGDPSTTSAPHIAASILNAAEIIAGRIEEALGRAGLSRAKQDALSALAESGEPLTLSELATRLNCVRSNITQLVDRLEKEGMVRRVNDPSDRRSIRAELTPFGAEKYRLGRGELERVHEEISETLSLHDLDLLDSALASIQVMRVESTHTDM